MLFEKFDEWEIRFVGKRLHLPRAEPLAILPRKRGSRVALRGDCDHGDGPAQRGNKGWQISRAWLPARLFEYLKLEDARR